MWTWTGRARPPFAIEPGPGQESVWDYPRPPRLASDPRRVTVGHWLEAVGWSYPEPTAAFAAIAGWLSFYPARLHCAVAAEEVRPQPGGFYGGWLTDEIVGPVKGAPGTGHW